MRTRCVWAVFLWWLYGVAVYELLRDVAPLYLDSGGPMPSLAWGKCLYPNLKEYTRHKFYFDSLYAIPCWMTALAVTAVGCCLAPTLARRLRPAHRSSTTAALTLGGLLVLCLASDIGTALRIWSGPVFLWPGPFDVHHALALGELLLPPALMAAVFVRIAP